MKILVIGGNRFTGRELVKLLVIEGHDVYVANRSGRVEKDGNSIANTIIFDRNRRESIVQMLGGQHWDVVYDMLCYSPKNAQEILGAISTDKYIMVSSSVVYDWGIDNKEADFLAEEYEPKQGSIEELGAIYGYKNGYRYGKMSAEAIVARWDQYRTLRVRFPLIIGQQDHTQRMEKYMSAIWNGVSLYIDNLKSCVSVVEKQHAAQYLEKLKDVDAIRVVNVCDKGTITIEALIHQIESILGKNVLYSSSGEEGGYNGYYDNVFNTTLLDSLGIQVQENRIGLYLNNLLKSVWEDMYENNR